MRVMMEMSNQIGETSKKMEENNKEMKEELCNKIWDTNKKIEENSKMESDNQQLREELK